MMFRRNCLQLLSGAVLVSALGLAQADNYPSKTLRLIVPASPGGGADFLARVVSPSLGEALGQSVVVDNRSGASGTIAADITAKAAGDGYTILLGQSTSIAVAPHMYEKLSYDTLRDLKPVTLVAEVPNILVVNPKVAANTVQELIALAKAKPNSLNYGSAGKGAPSHLAGELFEMATGAQITHVPYRGAGPSVNALLAGEIDVMFAPMVAVLPNVKAGRLRALAVTSGRRSAAVPELPTLAESGLKDFEISSWFGFFVPSSTPPAIVDKLQRETAKVLKQPGVIERLGKEGAEPVGNTPAEFNNYVRVEYAKFGKLVKEKNIKPE
jgi:tripartite-type tricarboxylate transporter receptor subunit TctC